MSGKSKIEWTGSTWNPIRARLKDSMERSATKDAPLKILPAGTWGYHCERVSPGCQNCYACTMNGRTLPAWGTGLDYTRQSRDKVEIYLDEQELLKPLHWKRGRFVFPCSMTDWCAEFVTDEMRDRMLAVCALTPQHTYQFLTKRAKRMREWFSGEIPLSSREILVMSQAAHTGKVIWDARGSERHNYSGCGRIGDISNRRPWPGWPLPNVWLGVSAEDQPRADERIAHLLATPAARRWVSYEPALGPLDLDSDKVDGLHALGCGNAQCLTRDKLPGCHGLDWIVAGGESGSGARPCDLAWLRAVVDQCRAAAVPCFVKQLGAAPYSPTDRIAPRGQHDLEKWPRPQGFSRFLNDRKGGKPAEWPADLRVREMPAAAGARA